MLTVSLTGRGSKDLRLLCLGAHSDDIEIGCGGTILRLLEENPAAEVCWVVLAGAGDRRAEATRSAQLFLSGARRKEVIVKEFRDGYFPYLGAQIKDFFEGLKQRSSPDLVLTHFREVTWYTFRNHLILEYEIVKYDGDLGAPNCFVHLTEDLVQKKIRNLMECFKTQRDKSWFTEDAFSSILRIRGIESNAPQRFAEGFYCRKLAF
jgi:LmbE family N-acetylglucosaminyl deacetylase